MKYPAVLLLLCTVSFAACHKSKIISAPSGVYVETSPTWGDMTLNFTGPATVVVTGSHFFVQPINAPDTMTYYMGFKSGWTTMSFVSMDSNRKDTMTWYFKTPGNNTIQLEFPPCPPGVPCYSMGGAVFAFEK